MSRLIPMMCVAIAGASLSAHAQKPKVVVVPFASGEGASETATGKFNALFVDELKTRGDVLELVAPPSTKAAPVAAPAAPAPGASGKGPSPEAVAALDAGRKAFDDLRFEDAVASLKKGVEGMLADPGTADYEAVTDAYVKIAAAAFRMGEEKDAKQTLVDLARLAPGYVMPPGFPPVFQREFEKAKKRLEKAPKGTISIEGPSGATAFIDGRDLGMVPVLEENVAGGMHYVKVEGGRSERFGQAVNITGGVVKVKASFGGGGGERQVITAKAGVADPAISANLDSETQNRLAAYVKAAGADYAFVGYVYKTSDTQLTAGTALFNPKKTAFSVLSPVAFDTDVLTANTEAFKLADELTKKLTSFGTVTPLPINLAAQRAKAGTSTMVAKTDKPTATQDDLDGTGPRSNGGAKVVLVPKNPPPDQNPEVQIDDKAPEVPTQSASVDKPVWPWVVLGVALAAGAGVGLGVGLSEGLKPVTGTVTATW